MSSLVFIDYFGHIRSYWKHTGNPGLHLEPWLLWNLCTWDPTFYILQLLQFKSDNLTLVMSEMPEESQKLSRFNPISHKFAALQGTLHVPGDRNISRPSSIKWFGPVFPLIASLCCFLDSRLNLMNHSVFHAQQMPNKDENNWIVSTVCIINRHKIQFFSLWLNIFCTILVKCLLISV